MTSVLEDEPGQFSRDDIKQEDTSAQTSTAVNRDVVTEHEHAQDLPETSGFQEQTTRHYENIQCKQEPTVYWDTAEQISGHVDAACTCNCNDHADVYDAKENITDADEYGILPTGVSFPGEVTMIKDTCEFIVRVHKSLSPRGVIDRLGVEHFKNSIETVLHRKFKNKVDIFRHIRTDCIYITKEDCDTAERKPTGIIHTQHKQHTCMTCGEDFICNLSDRHHGIANSGLESHLCEMCTSPSQTSEGREQVKLERIPVSGDISEQNTAGNSPQAKHTVQKRQLRDNSEKTLSNKYNVEEHRSGHTGEQPYTCTDCGRSFKNKSDFDSHSYEKQNAFKCTDYGNTHSVKYNSHSHIQAHTGDKTDHCTDSEHTFTHKGSLPRHKTSTQKENCDQASHHSDEAMINREPTGCSFETRETLTDGIKERCRITAQHHNWEDDDTFIPDELGNVNIADRGTTQDKQTSSKGDMTDCTRMNYYLCEHCGKTFHRKSILEEHLQVHMEERPYKCSECDKAYKHKSHLNRHMRIHTGERPYTCTFCDGAFTQKCHLTCHLRSHTGDRPYRCSQCGKTYKFDTSLTIHMRTHTGERPYICTYCHNTFTTKNDLNRHIRTHRGEKPHKCTCCDKTFVNKTHLTRHIRTHTGNKPYKCTLCDKMFARKHVLTNHIRTHTGEKPHKCTHCDKTFTTKCVLTDHIRIHTGEKPYKCTHCGKTFSTKRGLTLHIQIHTGEKPYTCNICGKMFARKYNLTRHMMVHTKHEPQ